VLGSVRRAMYSCDLIARRRSSCDEFVRFDCTAPFVVR
jgi:hypothetical protein